MAYRSAGIPRTARARKEILISGGAFNSPQLLQLSGIGPADLLRQHGVEVVLDAPGVGADLQDHMQVRVVMRCSQAVTLNDIVNNPVRKVLTGLRYAAFRTGPLTIAAGTSGAFFKTNPRLATPDIQIHFLPFSTDKMGEKLHPFSGFTASVCQLRPESRGSLRIKSANPAVPPEIRINYLASEVDRATNVEGLKILRKILRAPALTPYVVEEIDPGDKITSDEALLAYCRARGTTIYHPTSTCRMGTTRLPWSTSGCGFAGGWLAGDRCFRDARPRLGQYQRASDHDRGKGLRPDLARRALGVRSQHSHPSSLRTFANVKSTLLVTLAARCYSIGSIKTERA